MLMGFINIRRTQCFKVLSLVNFCKLFWKHFFTEIHFSSILRIYFSYVTLIFKNSIAGITYFAAQRLATGYLRRMYYNIILSNFAENSWFHYIHNEV